MLEILKFGAHHCTGCKAIEGKLNTIAKSVDGFKITEKDVEVEDRLVDLYKVFSIPTLIFVKDGVVVDKVVGANISISDLAGRIQKAL